ncbi:MAG: hypothetical protein ACLPV4_21235 [Solirubrobacteraceae bacterium]
MHSQNNGRRLTADDVDRAADVIARIAAIPTLRRGVVGFRSDLTGGWWYQNQNVSDPVRVQIPDSLEPDDIRRAIADAVDAERWDVLQAGVAADLAEDRENKLELANVLEIEGGFNE